MKTINWGIIGAGDVAEVKSGPAFNKVENSKLVAVMRRNATKAKDFAERHNVPFWYTSIEDLLENPEINAVYIATPPSTHLEIAKKCLQAKKFVYLEKPITLNYTEAKELKAFVSKNDTVVVAHYRRQLPAFLKVKELIDSNAIGKISFADITILQSKENKIITKTEANWRLNPKISGGGYFNDIAPHQIDLLLYYFGEIETAKGFAKSSQNNGVHELVNGIIDFKNGIQFRGIWNFNASEKDTKDVCKIYGEKGTITFSFYDEKVVLSTNEKEEIFDFENPVNIQKPMIVATVNYFLGKGKNPCDLENGVTVMKVIDAFTK
ncbi:Gfo/Idh/MocA family oxidoreductase [Polaribacter haliotis]|uniref:Gfo/Idh/MocA family oxidoreductase n=1 Tax=Polaribacter haliotis TaxID=1888915 RepID=A0A7L8AG49_9FLAO|nr:Gfo/Idh/MocA family oxidoreductase [Polaribacter haliotis]QOD60962.1 Gfo/Idh/MocA family oxidoreductase [Polaribacter haliotis]